jgi:hypothetical protein
MEYLVVQQELQSRTGPRFNTALPGKIYQVAGMVNFLLVGHARKAPMTCLNEAGFSSEQS